MLEIAQSMGEMPSLRNRPRLEMVAEPIKDTSYKARVVEKIRAIAINKSCKIWNQRNNESVQPSTEVDQHRFALISEYFQTELIKPLFKENILRAVDKTMMINDLMTQEAITLEASQAKEQQDVFKQQSEPPERLHQSNFCPVTTRSKFCTRTMVKVTTKSVSASAHNHCGPRS